VTNRQIGGLIVKTHAFPQAGVSGGDAPTLEWTVLSGRDPADRAWIETQGRFDDAIKAIIAKPPERNDRAHLEAAIVLSLVRGDDAAGDETIGLNMVIEAQRVTTISFAMDRSIEEAFDREVARGSAMSSSRVLLTVVTALIKQLQPALSDLADRIDLLEDAAMRDSDERIDDQVVLAGQQILALRRYLAPLNYEVNYLALNPDELPGGAEPRYLRRAGEALARIVSALDGGHHRVQLMLNQLGNRDTSRLEKSMHKLTLVATVFLPLSFITGLLGINVAGIPDSHDPVGFWVVCALLVGVAVASILVIRWKKWM
jgi:zinc transporter